MSPRLANALRQSVLTLGAGLGILCLLLAIAGPAWGIRLLVFQSGSMAPTVDTGGVALTRAVPADELAVGDIVSVSTSAGQRVTHRVVGIDDAEGLTSLTLQGDANPTPDAETYPVTEADRVLVHVDGLGFVVDALASPYAVFLAGALVGGLLLMTFRRRIVAPVAAMVVVAAVAGAPISGRIVPTLASFTDSAAVTASASSYKLAAPQNFRCGTLGVLSVVLIWDPVPGATSYTVEHATGTKTVESTSTSITGLLNLSGTARVRANRTFGSTTWTSDPSNSRNYTFLVLSLCS